MISRSRRVSGSGLLLVFVTLLMGWATATECAAWGVAGSLLETYRTLIAARLNHAGTRGVRVATIGSRPGAGTERNVRRMGFQTAYTKVMLARSGPGLVPNR